MDTYHDGYISIHGEEFRYHATIGSKSVQYRAYNKAGRIVADCDMSRDDRQTVEQVIEGIEADLEESLAELSVLTDLAELVGADTPLDYVGDCWGTEPCTMTPAEVIAMHRENGWLDHAFKTRPGTEPGEAVLVDHATGNPILQRLSLRKAARAAVQAEAVNAARKSHERNYERLYVGRDGKVWWSESISESTQILDDQAKGFRPVRSVTCVGTGSCKCDCEWCRDASYKDQADAIEDAVIETDTVAIGHELLGEFDQIPVGYFDDEEEPEQEEEDPAARFGLQNYF